MRALWLAERSVCRRVCKHGCDVKMFYFSRANHASTNLKKFLGSKLDKFTLFTHSFVAVSIFFAYADILIEKHPYFGKHLFTKQELITRARLRVQDFATGKNFSFNQCHNKEFCVFSRGKWFCKSNRELFSCVCIVWYKQTLEGLGELSTVMQTVMQTLDFVSGLHNYLEFSQPLSCLYQAMQSRKTFSIA